MNGPLLLLLLLLCRMSNVLRCQMTSAAFVVRSIFVEIVNKNEFLVNDWEIIELKRQDVDAQNQRFRIIGNYWHWQLFDCAQSSKQGWYSFR